MDGFMTCNATDRRVLMKDCVQWNHILRLKRFQPPAGWMADL